EAARELRIGAELGAEHLDGHAARGGAHALLGLVDAAHAAFADQPGDAVAPQDFLPQQRIRPRERSPALAAIPRVFCAFAAALFAPGHAPPSTLVAGQYMPDAPNETGDTASG